MPIFCTQEDRHLTAALSGELDHHAARQVMTELERHIDAALPARLTLDLEGLTFTDSSGIAVLLRARRHMDRLGGTMTVVRTPPQAFRVFQAAALERLISFESGREPDART